MSRALLCLLLVGACTRFTSARTAQHEERHESIDAAVAIDGDDDEGRARCEARCDTFVMTRHDACGPGGSWPAWCAESNRRMYDDCAAGCR